MICFYAMKTTLNINDHLYRAAERKASEEGKTLTCVVEDALRAFLHKPEAYKLKWTTLRGNPMPGINPDDRNSLYDAMDDRP